MGAGSSSFFDWTFFQPELTEEDRAHIVSEIPGLFMTSETLGSGVFGTVYRGTFEGNPVAVKTVWSGKTTEGEMLLFARSIIPQNVPTLYAERTVGEWYVVVQSLIDGETAFAVIENTPERTPEVVKGMSDIMLTLLSMGFHHNDAHLNNFMLSSSGTVFLLDMGLADYRNGVDAQERKDMYWEWMERVSTVGIPDAAYSQYFNSGTFPALEPNPVLDGFLEAISEQRDVVPLPVPEASTPGGEAVFTYFRRNLSP